MKATHKLTYLPDGDEYILCVVGNSFHWSKEGSSGWTGQVGMFTEHYVESPEWLVKKINRFKGNK